MYLIRVQFWYAPTQWKTLLHCNDISHWLISYLDWSLLISGHNGNEELKRLTEAKSDFSISVENLQYDTCVSEKLKTMLQISEKILNISWSLWSCVEGQTCGQKMKPFITKWNFQQVHTSFPDWLNHHGEKIYTFWVYGFKGFLYLLPFYTFVFQLFSVCLIIVKPSRPSCEYYH